MKTSTRKDTIREGERREKDHCSLPSVSQHLPHGLLGKAKVSFLKKHNFKEFCIFKL